MRFVRPNRRSDGGSLRARLMAVILVPVIGMSGIAASAVVDRVSTVRATTAARELVADAVAIEAIRSSFQQEVVPTLSVSFLSNPKLMEALGIPITMAPPLGDMPAELAKQKATTHDAIAAAASRRNLTSYVRGIDTRITAARKALTNSATYNEGHDDTNAIISGLGMHEVDLIKQAGQQGLSGRTASTLNDLQLVAQAVQLAGQELPAFASVKLAKVAPTLVGADVGQASEAWARLAGSAATASDLILRTATQETRALWWNTISTKEVAEFEATTSTSAAVNIPSTDPLSGIAAASAALRLDGPRNTALAAALRHCSEAALAAAQRQADQVKKQLWWLLSVTTLLGIGAMGGVLLVNRSVTAPLTALAGHATRVRDGELPDITPEGPREVRALAWALKDTSASLERIKQAATAVAEGDLDNEVVRQPLPGRLGDVVHGSVVRIIDAIEAKEAAQSALEYQAAHDALTDLPNRAQILDLIERSLHRGTRAGSSTGLMFVDLDRFKWVNDNLGHAAGDAVLQMAASRMNECVRGGDVVGRLGGDEFVIVLEDLDAGTNVVALAERVIERLSEPMTIGGRVAQVGASIGIAVSSDGHTDAGSLLREADAAVYRAKNAGRGQVGLFDDHLRATLAARADLETAILHGLEAGEFMLHYQPVVDLSTHAMHGVEALIRWDRPGVGMVPPDAFIPTAELSSLINDIGRWTLREATRQMVTWSTNPELSQLTMAVNVSGRHLSSPQLLDDVRAALEDSRIDPSKLILEITETVLVDDPRALTNMAEIRQLGVKLALDDFGTGFTSIGQLAHLPIDILKIDRSFTTSDNPTHRSLVELMVTAAHTFELNVVAEGLETADQASTLRNASADKGQGYFFARPQRADEVSQSLRRGSAD